MLQLVMFWNPKYNFRYALWLGENLWLADWSDDADRFYTTVNGTTTKIEDQNSAMMPTVKRLWVYAILGLSQARVEHHI